MSPAQHAAGLRTLSFARRRSHRAWRLRAFPRRLLQRPGVVLASLADFSESNGRCWNRFGFVAYLVMTWFVVPLSNAGNGSITFALPVMPVLINGILIHAFGVGLPAAYFASRVRP